MINIFTINFYLASFVVAVYFLYLCSGRKLRPVRNQLEIRQIMCVLEGANISVHIIAREVHIFLTSMLVEWILCSLHHSAYIYTDTKYIYMRTFSIGIYQSVYLVGLLNCMQGASILNHSKYAHTFSKRICSSIDSYELMYINFFFGIDYVELDSYLFTLRFLAFLWNTHAEKRTVSIRV